MSEQKNGQNRKEGNKGNKTLILVCIVAAVVITALVGVILMMMRSKDTAGETAGKEETRPVVVVEENAEEIAEQVLNQTAPEGIPLSYQVTMNSTWEFENGQAESKNAYVANAKENETAVYFDVIRNDTQETIYQSPVIPVGQELNNIVLDEDLEAGSYECTLTYHLIDDEQTTLTTVNMWLMIIVEN